jgi:hypothetical protein
MRLATRPAECYGQPMRCDGNPAVEHVVERRCCIWLVRGMLEAAIANWRQIAKASSSNATASRRFIGSSTASSSCPRRTFCTNTWPAMTTLALRSCFMPHIGRSLWVPEIQT